MSLHPIMTTPFYPPNLTRWNNEPILQAYAGLNELTRRNASPISFAEPVIRWEQQIVAGAPPAGTVTWYGPASYSRNPAAFRPLPEWDAQQPALTEKLLAALQDLVKTAPTSTQTLLLEAALIIPSLSAVLTDGNNQFILCPWGTWADNTAPTPFVKTPLGLLSKNLFSTPTAPPDNAPNEQATPQEPNTAPKTPPSLAFTTNTVPVLPARYLPRWLTIILSICVGLFFFLLAFWAGTLFLIHSALGVHIAHPFSIANVSLLWHFWSAALHASPDAITLFNEGSTR